jgi:ABC-2 type transport system permease protein
MTTATLAVRDSSTMLRRQLRRLMRYPALTVQLILMPIVILLLFVYVFGGTLGAGLGGDRRAYLDYVVPGILLMAGAMASGGTAVMVATDMTEGVVSRFRTMRIWRPSVLAGHVAASVVLQLLGMAAAVLAALAIGFRPNAGAGDWIAAAGLLALFALAIAWLSVALGLKSPTPEAAGNAPMPLMFLPFLGSGFVPTGSMPTVLRWFAEYQPFTPIMQTVRGLLLGSAIGHDGLVAVAWCVGIAAGSYLWAKSTFDKA